MALRYISLLSKFRPGKWNVRTNVTKSGVDLKPASSTQILEKNGNVEKPTESYNDGHPVVDLTFENAREAYRSKTTSELARALLVFKLCSVNYLVDNQIVLLKWSRKLLGGPLFRKMMKSTFYGHFVAGEDHDAIKPLISRNREFGVKSILDYSVEEDLSSDEAKEAEMMSCVSETETEAAAAERDIRYRAHKEFGDRREKVISARTYFYEDEAHCDENLETFMKCIDAVSDATEKSGLAAVKLTALGRPQLLLQMTEVLVSIRNIFDSICGVEGDICTKSVKEENFLEALQKMNIRISQNESKKWFSVLDVTKDGEVDLLDWENLLEMNMGLSKLLMVSNIKTGESKSLVMALSAEEENQMKNMLRRINTLVQYATEKEVRVMIDAEQTYFQPAISRLTMEMMRKFNRERAVIFNTYQCYLKSAFSNIFIDLDLSRRENFYFGAKLVRGAYLEQERERAATLNYEDPINDDYEATTAMYHCVLEEVFRQIQSRDRGKIAVMVASHNEGTVKFAVEKMKEWGVRPEDRLICFGQLLGMCDQISFPLGQAGYSVYKYVPFGPVEEVLPYLSRRGMENRGVLKKVVKEKRLLAAELSRRIRSGQLFYNPQTNIPSTAGVRSS
ncbi:proline dehydrogenase 1, mitochondrial-like isoform X2 [Haliotis rufescens]|uniref:proline dehydrogenase 1, mitochondrial-like isoform X2 n=1 Tax=Haliotis rufescens TaxID=6454 RepID=UPI00201F1511|nr:proline dehydrogenase 1, mitochondrial-like isoform X2 [Haliotis rufescens]